MTAETGDRRPQALVISCSYLARDPRVNRQLRWLRDRYRVTAAGLDDPRLDGVEFVLIGRPLDGLAVKLMAAPMLLLRQYERFYWSQGWVRDARVKLGSAAPDLVIANDPATWPLGLELGAGAPVILDAHEYAPAQFEDQLRVRVFLRDYHRYLCSAYMPRAAATLTVCDGIADRYESDVGTRPVVIWNAPDEEPLEPKPPAEDGVRMVHHGGAKTSRRLELMIEMMAHLDDHFTLDFYLIPGSPGYRTRLARLAAGDRRIRFREPVPMRQLSRVTNDYDVGLFLLPPTSFSYRHALPNKFFEFIQARLAVAIGPSPEMAPIVRQHDLGVVADDFSPRALAGRLEALTHRDIARYKANCHRVAEQFSSAAQARILLSLAERLRSEAGGTP